jgi:outer membrane protein W
MKRSLCLLTCLITIISFTTAFASDETYLKKGDWEVGFSGSYSDLKVEIDNESENISFLYADLNTAYFLIDNFSFGANLVWLYLPEVQDFSASALGLEGNVQYHFQVNSKFIPYLGLHAAYYAASADYDGYSESDSMNSYGVHGGFKIPINNNIYFDTQIKWTEYNMPWDEVDLSAIQILLGLKIKF